jgi:pSer/pThr/pTyr-binding forkhead associated (FHA) protein
MNAAIEAIAGPVKGQVFSLARDENSIGREPANAISILDGSVSRRHCLIRWDADQFILVDLGSRNRTLVNGAPVAEHVLRAGDEIRVGNSLFRFSPRRIRARIPPSSWTALSVPPRPSSCEKKTRFISNPATRSRSFRRRTAPSAT